MIYTFKILLRYKNKIKNQKHLAEYQLDAFGFVFLISSSAIDKLVSMLLLFSGNIRDSSIFS